MKTWIKTALASVTAVGVGAVMLGSLATQAKAEDAPIMTYGVDLVTDYVVRGVDQYVGKFALDEADQGPLNIAPAIQPWFTLFGGNGISLNIWTSFAISDRAPDTDKGFAGFSKLDELDYTLAYDWSNKLGGFTAAVIVYNYLYDDKAGAVVQPDYLLKWAMPYAKAVNPYLSYYASPTTGGEYAELGFAGGEAVAWGLVIGEKAGGVSHVTAKVGKAFGDFAVYANVALRPNPTLVGYPDADLDGDGKVDEGKYVNTDGDLKDYPSTIAWLTFSYSGSVAAK